MDKRRDPEMDKRLGTWHSIFIVVAVSVLMLWFYYDLFTDGIFTYQLKTGEEQTENLTKRECGRKNEIKKLLAAEAAHDEILRLVEKQLPRLDDETRAKVAGYLERAQGSLTLARTELTEACGPIPENGG